MNKKWNSYHLHSKVLRTTPCRQKPQIPGKDRSPQMGILSYIILKPYEFLGNYDVWIIKD